MTVLGDRSMASAIAEIARLYSREHRLATSTIFTPMADQEREITEGGVADVLITPRLSWIDQLKTQGLLDVYSQIEVAKNRLVLVGPTESDIEAHGGFPAMELRKAMNGEPLFIVGNPEYLLEGSYAKEALRSLGAAEDLEEYTLYVKDIEEMYGMVRGMGAYGIFFYSTTIGQEGVRVVDMLPESTHRPISYYAVVIAGDNMDQARRFLQFLKEPAARRVLRENGFTLD